MNYISVFVAGLNLLYMILYSTIGRLSTGNPLTYILFVFNPLYFFLTKLIAIVFGTEALVTIIIAINKEEYIEDRSRIIILNIIAIIVHILFYIYSEWFMSMQ